MYTKIDYFLSNKLLVKEKVFDVNYQGNLIIANPLGLLYFIEQQLPHQNIVRNAGGCDENYIVTRRCLAFRFSILW